MTSRDSRSGSLASGRCPWPPAVRSDGAVPKQRPQSSSAGSSAGSRNSRLGMDAGGMRGDLGMGLWRCLEREAIAAPRLGRAHLSSWRVISQRQKTIDAGAPVQLLFLACRFGTGEQDARRFDWCRGTGRLKMRGRGARRAAFWLKSVVLDGGSEGLTTPYEILRTVCTSTCHVICM